MYSFACTAKVPNSELSDRILFWHENIIIQGHVDCIMLYSEGIIDNFKIKLFNVINDLYCYRIIFPFTIARCIFIDTSHCDEIDS